MSRFEKVAVGVVVPLALIYWTLWMLNTGHHAGLF